SMSFRYLTAGLYLNVNPTLVLSPLARARSDLPDVTVVVRDRLLAEHVLARLDGRLVDRVVVAVAGDHVDDGDVVAGEQFAVVLGGDLRAKAAGRGRRA